MEKHIMGLQELENRFGTEEQCRDYLFKLRWPDGYRCSNVIGHGKQKNIDLDVKTKIVDI